MRLAVVADVARRRDLLELLARPRPHARAATVRPDAVDRGLDDDPQHVVAVQALGEGLPHAADGALQAPALALELVQPGLELAGHRVELLAEGGELVVALGGHLDGEVPGAEALGRDQQALDLRLQRPRHGEREGEGEHEEAQQRPGHDQRGVRQRGRRRGLAGEEVDLHPPAAERGRREAAEAVAAAVDLGRAAQRDPDRRPDAAHRRRDRLAVLGEDDLQAGEAPELPRVGVRGHHRDDQPADLALLVVDQRADRGRHGVFGAHRDRLHAVELEAARPHARGPRERPQPVRDARAVPRPDRGRELGVRAHLLGRRLPLALLLLEVAGRRPLRLRQPRVGLPGLRRRHEQEEHDGHDDHRNDHDPDEEQRQPTPEAAKRLQTGAKGAHQRGCGLGG